MLRIPIHGHLVLRALPEQLLEAREAAHAELVDLDRQPHHLARHAVSVEDCGAFGDAAVARPFGLVRHPIARAFDQRRDELQHNPWPRMRPIVALLLGQHGKSIARRDVLFRAGHVDTEGAGVELAASLVLDVLPRLAVQDLLAEVHLAIPLDEASRLQTR